MKTNTTEFIAEVIREIEGIKTHTTKYEKNNLNFITLNPDHYSTCIYGQLTGDCFEERATELIELINPKVRFVDCYSEESINIQITSLRNLTPLEVFISQYREYNEQIISYIKGKPFDLNLLYSLI